MAAADLPPIQVIVGPKIIGRDDNGEDEGDRRWYFSLNNRRLWVLKRCREEGLLLSNNNRIRVRVRQPKSEKERKRYTVQNCSLEAKFIREKVDSTDNKDRGEDHQKGEEGAFSHRPKVEEAGSDENYGRACAGGISPLLEDRFGKVSILCAEESEDGESTDDDGGTRRTMNVFSAFSVEDSDSNDD